MKYFALNIVVQVEADDHAHAEGIQKALLSTIERHPRVTNLYGHEAVQDTVPHEDQV